MENPSLREISLSLPPLSQGGVLFESKGTARLWMVVLCQGCAPNCVTCSIITI